MRGVLLWLVLLPRWVPLGLCPGLRIIGGVWWLCGIGWRLCCRRLGRGIWRRSRAGIRLCSRSLLRFLM